MEKTGLFIQLFYKLPLFLLKKLPLNFLSRAVGRLADHALSRPLIPLCAKGIGVDLEEAEHGITHYPTLNAFFTRGLKEGRRPFDPQKRYEVIAPADGKLSYGRITDGKVWAIKDKGYSLDKLLGKTDIREFHDGHVVIIYLSPRDYHRFHMPLDGKITAPPKRIGGYLFSVMPEVMKSVDDLFCVNERLVYSFENEIHGKFYMVAVGATFVGSIVDRIASDGRMSGETMRKGEELGAFQFGGSSIVVIMERDFPIHGKGSCPENGVAVRFGDVL